MRHTNIAHCFWEKRCYYFAGTKIYVSSSNMGILGSASTFFVLNIFPFMWYVKRMHFITFLHLLPKITAGISFEGNQSTF